MRSYLLVVLVLVLVLGLPVVAGPLAAQVAGEMPPVVGEVVEVNVVNVDVVVTDRDGQPVHGLTRDDFRLLEDGNGVEVVNFLEVADKRPVPWTVPTGSAGKTGEAVEAAIEPVTVVLYVDNTTLIPAHRNRVLGELREFVAEAMAAGGTRFMVVAFNPGLELLAPATGDPAVVSAALDRVAGMPAAGLLSQRDRQSARDHVQAIYIEVETSKGWGPLDGEAGPGNRRGKPSAATQGTRSRFFDVCTEAWGSMLNAVDSFAQSQQHRVDVAQSGLMELTRSLVGVPGRKVVLYMSDGMAQIPGLLEYQILGQICPDRTSEIFSYYNRFERAGAMDEITALANLNRVTFYALDTTGLGTLATASARSDDMRFTPTFQNQSEHRENMRASLFTMADQTGGRAFFNANLPGPELDRMARDYSNFYSLGFTPQNGWDGKVHKLKLKLEADANDDYKILYRARYRAMPQQERVAERTMAALVLGLEENPLEVELRPLGASRLEDGRYLVPLEISLSKARLVSLPVAGGQQCQLRLVLAIRGADGEVGPLKERVVPLELAAISEGPRHNLVIRLPLDAGSNLIALAVEDRLASVTSYLRTEIDPQSEREQSAP